jgi:predicted RNase H-like nuclease (RuvC/YqgF family)
MRKHKQEINKLLSLLSDTNINDYDDNESILDDPVKFRILTNKLDNLNTYKTKCQKLDLINRALNENLEKLKFELNNLKYNSGFNNNNSANNEKINNLIKHYEMQLEFKNNQIIKFRNEMDNMLILLKTLQTT